MKDKYIVKGLDNNEVEIKIYSDLNYHTGFSITDGKYSIRFLIDAEIMMEMIDGILDECLSTYYTHFRVIGE